VWAAFFVFPKGVVQVRQGEQVKFGKGSLGRAGIGALVVLECGLEEVGTGWEFGELDEDGVEFAENGQVVWKLFKNCCERVAGLKATLMMSMNELTVRKSPISFSNDARSQNASTFVGSRLYTFR
jgi:hypothetical protein